MRRTVAVLAAVVGLALVTGCESSPEPVAGTAAPVGGVTPAGTPSVTETTTTPQSSPTATTAEATTKETTRPPSKPSARLLLGPDGVGELKLGMSRSRAVKTGLLDQVRDESGAGCNSDYQPKSAGPADAPVFFDGEQGLVSFTAYPGLATPQEIKLGSSLAAVKKAYRDWDVLTGPGEDGRGHVAVPGNQDAVYNITIQDDQVVHMNLQLKTQNCYE